MDLHIYECAKTAFASSLDTAVGFTLNQIEYGAGKNTSVSTVPTAVPPISVYAIEPQKTENVRGMKANTAASAVRITGRDRCTVASTTA